MAKMTKKMQLQHAKTHLDRYTELHRHNPTAKNRKMMKYWRTRVKNLKGK